MPALPAAEAINGARHRSKPVNARWLSGPCRALAMRFDGLANTEAVVAEAHALLADDDWVMELLAPLIDAVRADPWFEPPFRASRDPLRTGAVLLDCEAVAIVATILSARALGNAPPPPTLVVPGRIAITRYVRGGNARMRRWRARAAGAGFTAATELPCIEQPSLILSDGLALTHDGRTQGHLIVAADGDIVTLTATLKSGGSALMREYRTADGGFVRAACADESASRMEMLLTFLRVSGRTDAADCFDAASRHPAFHLRWAAMREWLMLDARSARDRLAGIAGDDGNAEVRHAATATLAALDRRIAASCPV